MAAAFVRNHTGASNKTAGTTLALPLDAIVPAGSLLICRMVFDNAATASKPLIASIGRAAGETNTWVPLGAANSTSTSAGAFASGAMQCILTTVAWPAASYTVTLDTSTVQKAGAFQEFSGVLATPRSTGGTAYSTTTTAASAATTGTTPVIGDVALGFIFGSNAAANQAGDNDTTGGAWSAVTGIGSTGGNVATNNWGVGQYKILTAASAQTLNNSAAMTAGNGAIVAILQAAPPPVLAQAAYQFFDELGTEAAAAPLGAQNTNITGNIATGDGLGMLRVRVQNTGAINGLGTDDYQLQWEKNTSGTWVTVPSGAVIGYDAPSLTEGGATTSRLTGGSGTFIPGKIAEDGLVDNLAVTAANYTELVFALQLPAAQYTHGDSVRFRVIHNGSAAPFTYSVYPTINVINVAPAITQAAYRFYNGDDDETGQFAGIDGYSDINWDQTTNFLAVGGPGQTFMGNGKTLTRAGFYMRRVGSPGGTLTAYLYAHTGTFGTTGVGTGSPLATSTTTKPVSTIQTGVPTWHYFDFAGTYTLVNGTPYVIVVQNDTATTGGNSISVAHDASAPTHAGNLVTLGGAWTADSAKDLIFTVESLAAPLAAQDTAPTVDVTAGDVNMQVRMRLQSTTIAAIPSTDDWQLQWEKTAGTAILSDTHPSTKQDGLRVVTTSLWAQSFMSTGGFLTQVGFSLRKSAATPNGTMTAALYAHTGTFGSGNGLPTGSPIAVSTTVTPSSVLTVIDSWYYFDFDAFPLVTGPYCIVFSTTNTTSGAVQIGIDSTQSHAGTGSSFATSWASQFLDLIFEVYTKPVPAGAVLPVSPATTVSYNPTGSGDWPVGGEPGSGRGVSQSFAGGSSITRIGFQLRRLGTVAGVIKFGIFNSASGIPTGSPVATSTTVIDAATVPTSATFMYATFNPPVPTYSGSNYCAAAYTEADLSASAGNTVIASGNNTDISPGVMATVTSAGSWTVLTNWDLVHLIEGVGSTVVPYNSPNLTDGAATTNRLGAGTGSFVAGKVSEDGLVDNLGWTGNDYTEVLYAVTLKQADVVNGDTIRLKVLRNGATTGLTYTQTPTITIGSGTPTPQTWAGSTGNVGAAGQPGAFIPGARTWAGSTAGIGAAGQSRAMLQKAEWLTDTFDTAIDPVKWYNPSGVTVDAGRAKLSSNQSIYTQTQYKLIGSSFFAKVVPPTGASIGMDLYNDNPYISLEIRISGTQIWAASEGPGPYEESTHITYDPVAHAWLRLRESAGTVYFETSPDSVTWTSPWSYTTATPATLLTTPTYFAFLTGGSPNPAYIDNVNVVPLPKIELLTDTFDTTIDTGKWRSSVGVTVDAGRAKFVNGMLNSQRGYSLIDTSVFCKFTAPVDGNYSGVYLSTGSGNSAGIDIYDSVIMGWSQFGFYEQSVEIPYNPVAHAWVRIRETAGTVYLETSPDSATWTPLAHSRSTALSNWSTSAGELIVYTGDVSPAYLDNVNVAVGAPVGGKFKVWNGTSHVAKPVKVWNGTAWVEKPLKHWTGTAWKVSS